MPEPDRFVQRTKMPSPQDPSQRIAEDLVASHLGVREGARTPAQSAGPNETVGPAFNRHNQLAQFYILSHPVVRVVHTLGRERFALLTSPLYQSRYQKMGHMGKRILIKFLRRRIGGFAACALLALPISGCETDVAEKLQSGKVLALYGLQGRWVGSVTPVDASCGPATRGVLTIGGGDFGFDPFQSSTIIQGTVGRDGQLGGIFIRQDSHHQPISISFNAAAAGGEAITGELVSGRCHWAVALRRG
jgi:hypothetical protein